MRLFKLKTSIRRWLVKIFKINRPPSLPFITGDGFRSLAQHILDENSDIDTNLIDEKDIIFVRNDFLELFFNKYHPKITKSYILISNNDDSNIPDNSSNFVQDPKIIHWFAKNSTIKHDKITPIPIGLTNYYYNYLCRGKISYVYDAINQRINKKNNISYGFSTTSNSYERQQLKTKLSKNKIAYSIETGEQSVYLKKMFEYKFTISPEGNGIDCHRTWEALYLKTIPIVKRSIVTESFSSLGIPLVIVDDWNDLDKLDEHTLSQIYENHIKDFDNPAIYMQYWIELILEKKS